MLDACFWNLTLTVSLNSLTFSLSFINYRRIFCSIAGSDLLNMLWLSITISVYYFIFALLAPFHLCIISQCGRSNHANVWCWKICTWCIFFSILFHTIFQKKEKVRRARFSKRKKIVEYFYSLEVTFLYESSKLYKNKYSCLKTLISTCTAV